MTGLKTPEIERAGLPANEFRAKHENEVAR